MSALLKRIEEAFHKMLMLFKPVKAVVEPVSNDTYFEIKEDKAVSKSKKASEHEKLDEKKHFPETFSELLDKIETTFDSYSDKSFKFSWLSKDEQIGLKKLGAYVPNPWQIRWLKDNSKITVNQTKKYPSMMFVSLQASKVPEADDDKIYPDFMFGLKLNKLPWNVEKIEGIPYKFGYAYKDKLFNKVFWMYAWVVIDADCKIHICKERRVQNIVIKTGENKGREYARKVWKTADLLDGFADYHSLYAAENSVLNTFAGMFNWWLGRNDRWSVSVKYKGERLTFSVDKSLTKKYFADRDKSIKTPSGKAKKIVHYVGEFKRVVKGKEQTVREHIRGLDRFNWKGYECFVKAPEFHTLASVEYHAASEEITNDETDKNFILTSKLGLVISQIEDASQRVYH